MNHATHRIAANALFIAHCAVSVFAVLGALLVMTHKAWMWVHVPLVLWFFVMNLFDWSCPLTVWEKDLRVRMAQPYSDSFITHYLKPILDANGEPRRLEIIIGISILLWNALLYSVIYAI